MTVDSVVEIPWFSDTLPEGAFAAKGDLLNGDRRVVLSPMKRGEAVLRSKITGPGQRASLASLLDEGRRAVTVQVDDVRGVAGFVLPGDFVDIVIIADDGSTKRQSYSDILLEHIKVLAIDQVASEGEGQPTVAKAVTVEVTKEQAQKILLATNIGKLSLILSRPLEAKPEPNRRVSEKDIGRTTPEPVRAAAPPPPASIVAAPVVPSNTVKISIVRNGETKEYTVVRTDVTDGKRTSRAN
jgi:pilus assembly protein CpaB